MSLQLLLGTAEVNITPSTPIPLAGLMVRQQNFTHVLHPIYARIFMFQQQDSSGFIHRALLVVADLIWWGDERVKKLKQQLYERWEIEQKYIILHATHNHSAPQTSQRFVPSLGKLNHDYIQHLDNKILEGVALALENLEPVTIEKGYGICDIGIYRRKFIQDKIQTAPNSNGPKDTEIQVVRFQTISGKTKGLLIHYACHPIINIDPFVTSEFPGVTAHSVKQALGTDPLVAFLQGCCGDIQPSLVRNHDFYYGSKYIKQVAESLADRVLQILACPLQPLKSGKLNGKVKQIQLPFQSLPTRKILKTNLQQPYVEKEWAKLLLDQPERLRSSIPLEMTALSLADELTILAVNSELAVEYGHFIKAYSNKTILPLPYSNGMIGYIPTAQQIKEGGYEAKESTFYFGLPAPFKPSIEKLIKENIVKFIEKR